MPRPSDFMQRNPVRLDISRSRFRMTPRWTGTFNAYKLVPVLTYTDVLPGDTFKLSSSFVCRMSTPVVPVMDDLFMDVAFYFVPHELILSRSYMSPSTSDSNHSWKAFMGAQDSFLNMPFPDSDIELPYMYIGSSYYVTGGIADCMGIPFAPTRGSFKVNCLAPLAFMAVWNENYRDPNTEQPGVFSIVSNAVNLTWYAAFGDSLTHPVISDAQLPNVCRFHGYFGSALPWPQRNSETVKMPLGTTAPIEADGDLKVLDVDSDQVGNLVASDNSNVSGISGVFGTAVSGGSNIKYSSGLMVDLAQASAVSINTFRLAVQEQRWYEALARGGNRIDELTAALFGVMPKDAGGNQPEYLGGKRVPLSISQVNVTANSSSGGSNDNVGNTGAFSLTGDSSYYFTKSFDRWGSIIGVTCVRYRDSFGRSLNRMFTRRKRFDFYFPQFANLGEQPIYQHELDIDLKNAGNSDWPISDVFGYQEAWADYRTIPDIVCGEVRPGGSLQHWTYAGIFAGNAQGEVTTGDPTLAGFLSGSKAYKAIDRSLIVKSETSGFQFLAQFQHEIIAVRPMPLYSIPGLVDHH